MGECKHKYTLLLKFMIFKNMGVKQGHMQILLVDLHLLIISQVLYAPKYLYA